MFSMRCMDIFQYIKPTISQIFKRFYQTVGLVGWNMTAVLNNQVIASEVWLGKYRADAFAAALIHPKIGYLIIGGPFQVLGQDIDPRNVGLWEQMAKP